MSIALIKKTIELEKRIHNLEYRLDTGLRLNPEELEDHIKVQEDSSNDKNKEDVLAHIFTEDQLSLIRKASEHEFMPVRDFVTGICIEHANNILNKKD